MMKTSLDKTRLKKLMIIALILLLYFLFALFTGYGIPCVFHLLTGLNCPGCGISRMFLSLAKGDLSAAFQYNALVLCLLPLFLTLIVYWITGWLCHRKAGKKGKRIEKALYLFLIAALLLWGVVRNLIGM